jgi:hypothetical protein
VFRTVHAPGYEGWTVSRYRQRTGPTPDWEPSGILRDMHSDRMRPLAAIPTTDTGDAVKGILTAMAMGKDKDKELTNATLAARTMGGANSSGAVPMRIISELIASGACDRHPNLLWNTIEYNAGWLAHRQSRAGC